MTNCKVVIVNTGRSTSAPSRTCALVTSSAPPKQHNISSSRVPTTLGRACAANAQQRAGCVRGRQHRPALMHSPKRLACSCRSPAPTHNHAGPRTPPATTHAIACCRTPRTRCPVSRDQQVAAHQVSQLVRACAAGCWLLGWFTMLKLCLSRLD